jgi:hypothetical protein
MTTSSSDTARGTRCTRISPSAILDDRLTGRDLDWARDHLRRCDTCRGRIEDFQEMRLRLDRLPHAPLSGAAIEDAFVVAVPNAPRPVPSQARLVGAPSPMPAPSPTPEIPFSPPYAEVPTAPLPDMASVPDLLSELEREIFRDTPWGEHPAGLMTGTFPAPEAPAPVEDVRVEPEPVEPPMVLRQVPVESGRQPEPLEEVIPVTEAAIPVTEAALPAAEVELPTAERELPAAQVTVPPTETELPTAEMDLRAAEPEPPAVEPDPPAADAEPVAAEAELTVPSESAAVTMTPSQGRADTVVRLAVGMGAAACVLLAALLYETGWFPTGRTIASTTPRPAATAARPSHSPTAAPTVTPTPTPAPTPSPVVLATLGQGITGESVFRIRPGTAVSSYTRLVFDLTGRGLPTMVITQPDAMHLQVTFKDTGGANVPVGGIRSPQVQGIEPAVQQGPDLVIMIDLAAPIRLTDFTLPPAAGYAPRLVLDLHSA